MSTINICWIIPQYSSLLLSPGTGSPLSGLVSAGGEVISYDGQINFPHAGAIITTARRLQSALPSDTITCSILNLAAVPRSVYSASRLSPDYVSEQYAEIPFGHSRVEVRRLGMDIGKLPNLRALFQKIDVVVVASSFETHVNEMKRIGRLLRPEISAPLMASGHAVEGHEESLLDAGFDLVFSGSATDGGEAVLKALLENDRETLSSYSGVSMDTGEVRMKNAPTRSSSWPDSVRRRNVSRWQRNYGRYDRFIPVSFRMIGRSDLVCGIDADPAFQYCCAMQDLPYEDLVRTLPAGEKVVFAADEFFPAAGCPRSDCDFCHASGAGSALRSMSTCLALLDFYKSKGATDLIPADDQIFLLASRSMERAADLAAVYEYALNNEFKFFHGNGIESLAFLHCLRKARRGSSDEKRVYGRLIDAFLQSLEYIYLPYERLDALTGDGGKSMQKLQEGKSAYREVLQYLDTFARLYRRRPLEVGSSIIFSETPEKDEISDYYAVMDRIVADYPELRIRFNGFFMIPSSCAAHIRRYRREYTLFSDAWPELKIVSVPTILRRGEDMFMLEKRLAWNMEARARSKSRRILSDGVYR